MQTNYSSNGNQAPVQPPATAPVPQSAGYQLTADPVFYMTVIFFALLTTLVPGLMGQPNFMPIVQALGLTIFAAIPLRRGELRNALWVTAVWLIVQLLTIILVTWLVPLQATRAIADGFDYRSLLVTWAYTGENLPRSLALAPLARLGEITGVLLGSLLTGGLAGSWFLVRGVDLLGYSAASLSQETVPALGFLLGLSPWRLLTVAGYAGTFLLLAQPILTNHWRPGYYLQAQRSLVLGSAALLSAGLLLEALLPGIWQALLGPG